MLIIKDFCGDCILPIFLKHLARSLMSVVVWVHLQMTYRQKKALKSSFDLVSLFNGISTLVGYLMPKPFFEKNSSGTI